MSPWRRVPARAGEVIDNWLPWRRWYFEIQGEGFGRRFAWSRDQAIARGDRIARKAGLILEWEVLGE